MKKHVLALAILGSLVMAGVAAGTEPGCVGGTIRCAAEPRWEGGVVRFGVERERIRNMHILDRPYRLFHVYGNTVRRMYYRGQLLPSLEDFAHMLDL
ncbi:MAG: hypothetical protein ACODAD_06440 [Planctomycetota bacterium]